MYSQDLRDGLVRAVDEGMSRRSAARVFGVSASTAINWVMRWREVGTVSPRGVGGDRRSHVIEAERERLLALLSERPDTTLEEYQATLYGHGVCVSVSAIDRFFDRHEISFKKNRSGQRTRAARRGTGAPAMAAASTRI